jgi:pimeloyl-ACP methyl ester carboxylesterase
MPEFSANGINLYYEITGTGYPLLFSHEFAGDYTSWDAQVRSFSRKYQVITYNARGYPPSDVPETANQYSQDHSIDDIKLLLDHLHIDQAYLCGLSMGGSAVLNFGLRYPHMARALIVASAGSGSDNPKGFKESGNTLADKLMSEGMERGIRDYANGPTRVQLTRKDNKSWLDFYQGLCSHSAIGSAMTFRGIQLKRPSIYTLESDLHKLTIPTLIMIGDEDEPCIGPAIFMKKHLPSAGLSVFPQSGHAINLEEPDLFNRTIQEFIHQVESGAWV